MTIGKSTHFPTNPLCILTLWAKKDRFFLSPTKTADLNRFMINDSLNHNIPKLRSLDDHIQQQSLCGGRTQVLLGGQTGLRCVQFEYQPPFTLAKRSCGDDKVAICQGNK